MSSQLLYLSAFRGKLVHRPYPASLLSLTFHTRQVLLQQRRQRYFKWICLVHGQQDNDKSNSCLNTPSPFITKQSNKVLSRKLEESICDALFDGIEIKLLFSGSKYQIYEGFLKCTIW